MSLETSLASHAFVVAVAEWTEQGFYRMELWNANFA